MSTLDYQIQSTAKAIGHLAAAYQAALNENERLVKQRNRYAAALSEIRGANGPEAALAARVLADALDD